MIPPLPPSTEGGEVNGTEESFVSSLFESSIAIEETYEVAPAIEGIASKIWDAIKNILQAIANFFKSLFSKSTQISKQAIAKNKQANEINKTSKILLIQDTHTKSDEEQAKEARNKRREKNQKYAKNKQEFSVDGVPNSNTGRLASDNSDKVNAGIDQRNVIAGKLDTRNFGEMTISHNTLNGTLIRELDKYQQLIQSYGQLLSTTSIGTFKEIRQIVIELNGVFNKLTQMGSNKPITEETIKNVATEYKKNAKNIDDDSAPAKLHGNYMTKDLEHAKSVLKQINSIRQNIISLRSDIANKATNDTYVRVFIMRPSQSNKPLQINITDFMNFMTVSDSKFIKSLIEVADNIAKESKMHENFCSKLIPVADRMRQQDPNDRDAKLVFNLCKGYMECSKLFQEFSARANEFISGKLTQNINTHSNKNFTLPEDKMREYEVKKFSN